MHSGVVFLKHQPVNVRLLRNKTPKVVRECQANDVWGTQGSWMVDLIILIQLWGYYELLARWADELLGFVIYNTGLYILYRTHLTSIFIIFDGQPPPIQGRNSNQNRNHLGSINIYYT